MKRTTYAAALLAVVGTIAIAGCGGGGSSSSSAPAANGEGTISSAAIGGLGNVLVDSEGMTAYLYTPDEGKKSVCYGECEAAWPPVVAAGKPSAGEGAMSSDLGTTKRKDGTLQVTYKGHPLYTFAGDKAPGEANGQELEGTWFVLDEEGEEVEGKAAAGGGGNGY